MTEEQIMEAAGICKTGNCMGCPYHELYTASCINKLMKDVFDLISHRKAEPADGGGAADAAKTRHGKWIDDRKEIDTVGGVRMRALVGYTCSVCGHSENRKYPFCNCGAKMGEEQECGTWRGEYIWR